MVFRTACALSYTIYCHKMDIPWNPSVSILQRKDSVLAVDKPCGVLSHPNRSGVCRCALIKAPYDAQAEAYQVERQPVYLLNRLDSPTSGLVLLCTDFARAQQIRALFRIHHVQKVYEAIVKGEWGGKSLIWRDRLSIQKQKDYVRARCSCQGGVLAQTRVKGNKTFLFQGETVSYIQLFPVTGRTHQLRVQCASHGFPILGDKTYGDFAWNRRCKAARLYLHAAYLAFTLPDLSFEASCETAFRPLEKRVSERLFSDLER